ncbi:MAG: hypothetical protein AAGN35_02625 [Bacteroidota bacterium]
MTEHEYLLQIDAHIQAQQLHPALELIDDCLRTYPDFGPAYNHKGWLHAGLGQYQLAEKNYLLAIEKAPEFPSTYMNRAILLNSLGKHDALDALVEQAAEIPGVRKDILAFEHGISLELRTRFSEAIAAYKTGIRYSLIEGDVQHYGAAIQRCKRKAELLAE